jgi:hypothetical protein
MPAVCARVSPVPAWAVSVGVDVGGEELVGVDGTEAVVGALMVDMGMGRPMGLVEDEGELVIGVNVEKVDEARLALLVMDELALVSVDSGDEGVGLGLGKLLEAWGRLLEAWEDDAGDVTGVLVNVADVGAGCVEVGDGEGDVVKIVVVVKTVVTPLGAIVVVAKTVLNRVRLTVDRVNIVVKTSVVTVDVVIASSSLLITFPLPEKRA